MYNHAPKNYRCPICLGAKKAGQNGTLILPQDIIFRDNNVFAFMSSYQYGEIPLHVIVSPAKHFENIYNMPEKELSQIMVAAKKIALALKKVYKCDGIMLQQNNEPASDQHAFHFHLHIWPRFSNDNFFKQFTDRKIASPDERAQASEKIKQSLLD